MKLDFEQIKAITTGAVRIQQEEDGIHFYRFTEEQQNLYAGVSADFLKKTHATSGVKFCFRTNSENFSIKWLAINGSGRTFFQFDVFVNGKRIESFGNFDADTVTREYTSFSYPLGEFEKAVSPGRKMSAFTSLIPSERWSRRSPSTTARGSRLRFRRRKL